MQLVWGKEDNILHLFA